MEIFGFISMPKISIDKNSYFASRNYNVGFSW